MIKNNIEIDVKVKCIEADTTQAKLAAAIGTTPPYINRLVRNGEVVVNKTFVKMFEGPGPPRETDIQGALLLCGCNR